MYQIYIPPCIYLNVSRLLILCCICFIYIPPCIYLNLVKRATYKTCPVIYIPPCIYLNWVVSPALTVAHHLHSTMYLFKPLCCVKYTVAVYIYMYLFKPLTSFPNPGAMEIYIPPCIYLNLTPFSPSPMPIHIYIPPCIYLNAFDCIRHFIIV